MSNKTWPIWLALPTAALLGSCHIKDHSSLFLELPENSKVNFQMIECEGLISDLRPFVAFPLMGQ